MSKIKIHHIEKHLFDKTKHGWDKNIYPLYKRTKITNVKVLEVRDAKPYESLARLLQFKRH